MADRTRDVWITGIGLVSSLGEGVEAHVASLGNADTAARVDAETFEPYPVHPLVPLDIGKQIPKKSDQRQMEAWQRIGVYAAGLALEDAGIAHQEEYLSRTNLVVAAGSGERDTAVDAKVLEAISSRSDEAVLAKEILPTALRPTLFLAQLSNLLAGNISIVHHITGASRTFMGEEMAGISAVENAVRRIHAGQGDLFVVGGALNAEREDLLLGYELGCNLWAHPFRPVWERRAEGGGFVPGSVGAFLVLEARAHAEQRDADPYACISQVESDHARRAAPGEITSSLNDMFDRLAPGPKPGSLAVMSGTSGVEPASAEELTFIESLGGRHPDVAVRGYGSRFGHAVEAQFPLGIALAALALDHGSLYPPFDSTGVEQEFAGPLAQVLVTGLGHWRGEGLALLEAVVGKE